MPDRERKRVTDHRSSQQENGYKSHIFKILHKGDVPPLSTVNQTNTDTVSEASFGKPLRPMGFPERVDTTFYCSISVYIRTNVTSTQTLFQYNLIKQFCKDKSAICFVIYRLAVVRLDFTLRISLERCSLDRFCRQQNSTPRQHALSPTFTCLEKPRS